MDSDWSRHWIRVIAPAYCLALAVLSGAVALSPIVFDCVALSHGERLAIGGLAVLQLLIAAAVQAQRGGANAIATLALISTTALSAALAPVSRLEPSGVLLLLTGLFAVSALVGPAVGITAVCGSAIGTAIGLAWMPPVLNSATFMLSIENSYHGVGVEPSWLSFNAALAVTSLTILIAAVPVALAERQRRLRELLQRESALDRIVRGQGGLGVGQRDTVVATLADPQWALFGMGTVEWGTIRITTVRTPSDAPQWRGVAQSLRDATASLADVGNPLVQAARHAQPIAIASWVDLLHGIWRDVDRSQLKDEAAARGGGWVIPFGTAAERGVLFALSPGPTADFGWLEEMAGALTMLHCPVTAPAT